MFLCGKVAGEITRQPCDRFSQCKSEISKYSCDFSSLGSQAAGREEDGLVMWDYHVILVVKDDSSHSLVYDLDTILPFPVSFKTYCDSTFGDESSIMEKFRRKFRVVPGADYLSGLSSDRRHMRSDKEDREWLQPPPLWPCIQGNRGEEHNLESFISMEESQGVGVVCDLEKFVKMFSS